MTERLTHITQRQTVRLIISVSYARNRAFPSSSAIRAISNPAYFSSLLNGCWESFQSASLLVCFPHRSGSKTDL